MKTDLTSERILKCSDGPDSQWWATELLTDRISDDAQAYQSRNPETALRRITKGYALWRPLRICIDQSDVPRRLSEGRNIFPEFVADHFVDGTCIRLNASDLLAPRSPKRLISAHIKPEPTFAIWSLKNA